MYRFVYVLRSGIDTYCHHRNKKRFYEGLLRATTHFVSGCMNHGTFLISDCYKFNLSIVCVWHIHCFYHLTNHTGGKDLKWLHAAGCNPDDVTIVRKHYPKFNHRTINADLLYQANKRAVQKPGLKRSRRSFLRIKSRFGRT